MCVCAVGCCGMLWDAVYAVYAVGAVGCRGTVSWMLSMDAELDATDAAKMP